MMKRALAVFALAPALLSAQPQIQKALARLSEEADAFRRLAPEVLAQETLHQKTLKPPSRFRPRVGDAARKPPPLAWQERELVSEYAFTKFSGEEDTLHELRQVISVDGKPVKEAKNAEETLARIITMKDAERQQQLLKEIEKYGLVGAATDFGQLILLFTPRNMERFEFHEVGGGPHMLGSQPALVFAYSQLDGPPALTIFPTRPGIDPLKVRAEGAVWVREDNLLPLRITLTGRRVTGGVEVREEASVDYALSRFGALLPSATHHQELRSDQPVAENTFVYADFHRFGASSELHFDFQK